MEEISLEQELKNATKALAVRIIILVLIIAYVCIYKMLIKNITPNLLEFVFLATSAFDALWTKIEVLFLDLKMFIQDNNVK